LKDRFGRAEFFEEGPRQYMTDLWNFGQCQLVSQIFLHDRLVKARKYYEGFLT
jgi:hypothetical protein